MKHDKKQAHINELTVDLQRTRADFENYRKRMEAEQIQQNERTRAATIMKLLPIVDTVERAVAHVPAKLADDPWAKGVTSLIKNLEKSLGELNVSRIPAEPGTPFDPELHEAVSMEDEGGEHESIAEELRAGYKLGSLVIRPSMVRVRR
ncbi:MAG TPA: nucleotide exchange factor GrpE [Candidatus Saccharimonadales bacterium]|nr:nucleotide exchange factor GrpE [Candidatus Saccharimonadales bacterium]